MTKFPLKSLLIERGPFTWQCIVTCIQRMRVVAHLRVICSESGKPDKVIQKNSRALAWSICRVFRLTHGELIRKFLLPSKPARHAETETWSLAPSKKLWGWHRQRHLEFSSMALCNSSFVSARSAFGR